MQRQIVVDRDGVRSILSASPDNRQRKTMLVQHWNVYRESHSHASDRRTHKQMPVASRTGITESTNGGTQT